MKELIFMALCADLGMLLKKLAGPVSNILTGALHIPGGISSAFSLALIVVGAALVGRFGSAILMSLVQFFTALAFGSLGSMGLLVIISYLLSGLTIDLVCLLSDRLGLNMELKCFAACIAASASCCISADIIVFKLRGLAFCMYLLIAMFSGALAGYLVSILTARLKKTKIFDFNN